MAKRDLNGVKDADELRRRVDAIKKQFTRKETGSMAKFRNILDNDLEDYKDFLT
jgi:hypothetical protein